VSVSRMALHRFLKKYGLEQTGRVVALPLPAPAAEQATPAAAAPRADDQRPADTPPPAARSGVEFTPVGATAAASPTPRETRLPPEFFLPPPSTPAPSCSCPKPSTGWPSLGTASPMTTARCRAGS
jgi:hypothetical protein